MDRLGLREEIVGILDTGDTDFNREIGFTPSRDLAEEQANQILAQVDSYIKAKIGEATQQERERILELLPKITKRFCPGVIRPVGVDNYIHVVMPMFVQW